MILASGLEVDERIRIGDLVSITQHWSAYVGGQLQEGWTHIGEGIFIGFGTDTGLLNGGLIQRVDHVCVMMAQGIAWFNPSRLKLTLVSSMDEIGVDSVGADLQGTPWTDPAVH